MKSKEIVAIVVLALALIVVGAIALNTANPKGTPSTKPSVAIGKCISVEKPTELECNGTVTTGYVALPENIEKVSLVKRENNYIVDIAGSGPACIHKIQLENIDGTVIIRLVENNVPFTVGKLDTNACKWILR